MADIQVKGGKSVPKVDLAAMVDLALLLTTFFMFTTTMSKPKAMQLQMPFKDEKLTEEEQNKIKKDEALTIIVGADHKLYYYEGIGDDPNEPPAVKEATFSAENGIRDVIIEKKKKVRDLISSGVLFADDKLTVVIKPDEASTTDDLIGVLDEMTINQVPVYAVVDITDIDKDFVKNNVIR